MKHNNDLFCVPIAVRWGDMDALGHVNNTVYFQYMEEARLRWLNTIGFTIEPGKTGPVLAHTSLDFMRPLVYPQQVELHQKTQPPGRSSVKLIYDFVLLGTQDVIARGEAVVVWVDYKTGQSISIPNELRSFLPPPLAHN